MTWLMCLLSSLYLHSRYRLNVSPDNRSYHTPSVTPDRQLVGWGCTLVSPRILGLLRYRISNPETHLKHKSWINCRLPKTYSSGSQSFCEFPHSMVLILPCSVQNFKTIAQQKKMLWALDVSQYLSLRWVSQGYPYIEMIARGWT